MEGDPLVVKVLITRKSILKLLVVCFLALIGGEHVMVIEDESS